MIPKLPPTLKAAERRPDRPAPPPASETADPATAGREPVTGRRRWAPLLGALIPPLVAVAAVTLLSGGGSSASADPPPEAPAVDEVELDRLIDVFEQRAADRGDSVEYRFLGALLLQRADLRADVGDYRAATDAYRASLDIAPGDREGLLGLGQAALGIHDFATANHAAADLLAARPDDPDALALTVDAAFAVGDYEPAAEALALLQATRPDDPAILVRASQLALVPTDGTGGPGRSDGSGGAGLAGPDGAASVRALELADQAVTLVEGADQPADQLAYYLAYAGRLRFDHGDYDGAAERLIRANELAPGDQGILGELARVRAASGELDEAIALLRQANDLVPEPDHLFLQAQLERLTGDTEMAEAHEALGVELATIDADHERAWARALAHHHLDVSGDAGEGLRLAEAEAAARSDVGALDLLAWARYRTGDLEGAAEAADRAVALGIPDAGAYHHAAVIAIAGGDDARAAELLRAALALHPRFDPVAADEAEALLAELT